MNRDVWYRNPEIIYLIIQQCRDREIAFLGKSRSEYAVRNIHAHYSNILIKNFDAFNFFSRQYNVYYSLGKFKPIQIFSFNPEMRKKQRLEWNENIMTKMFSYDLGLDFDSEGLHDLKRSLNDCKLVKQDFDKYNIPYSLKFSGSKGFHIRVPFDALPNKLFSIDNDEPDSIFFFLKSVAELMKEYYSRNYYFMDTLDLGVFDHRRIWKCDYSWTCETGLIALPLTDEQFDNFSLDMVEPLNVLKAGIRNRGDLMRKGSNVGFKNYCREILGIMV